jgi:hypothetical protein
MKRRAVLHQLAGFSALRFCIPLLGANAFSIEPLIRPKPGHLRLALEYKAAEEPRIAIPRYIAELKKLILD